jgi:hypothetical protein
MTGRGRVADLRAATAPAHGRRPALRDVRPGAVAVAEATELLDIAPRRRQEPLAVQAQNPVDASVMPPRSCPA